MASKKEEAPAAPMIEIHNFDKFEGFVNFGDDIFQVDFKPMNKAIMIKCFNTNDKNSDNKVYSYELTKGEVTKIFGDYFNFIDELRANSNACLKLEKLNDSLLLIILLGQNNQIKNLKLPLQIFNEEDIIEECEINNNQYIIKKLNKELKKQREEIKNLNIKINIMQKNFEDLEAKMNLFFRYNSFDPEVSILDHIYQNLSSKHIIQNELDFSLINKGIRHLFQKNIVMFDLLYKSGGLEFEYGKFYKKLKDSENSILIILTQDKRRFGAFFKSNNINKFEINNLNNNEMGMTTHRMNNTQNVAYSKNISYKKTANKPYPQMNIYIQNNNNFQNANPYNEQQNIINNQTYSKIIFDSSFIKGDYCIFSFDSSQIFYSNNNNNNLYGIRIPSFSIGLTRTELTRGVLIGKENPSPISGFILNGAPEFNIVEMELYSI